MTRQDDTEPSHSPPNPNPSPEAWGVSERYQDYAQRWHDVPRSTVDRILRGMGAATPVPVPGDEPTMVVGPDDRPAPFGDAAWVLEEEDGREVRGAGALPAGLPLGYHHLRRAAAAGSEGREGDDRPAPGSTLLIVAPSACPGIDELWAWGWAVQLYALRSQRSWGIGDLGDLRQFMAADQAEPAGFVLLNPLHAPLPGAHPDPSPYYPSSREFRSPLYLRIADVPGADEVGGVREIAEVAQRLNDDRLIDRTAVWAHKLRALQLIWEACGGVPGSPAFEEYCAQQGAALERYATFCAIYEAHPCPWQEWPSALQHPSSEEVHQFAISHADRVRFHQWLQWLVDLQLASAGATTAIINDLAVGVDPSGADAWLWQDALALDMRVGAPPDEFNTQGQDWGLPPFDPWKLRTAHYQPFIGMVRSALRHTSGLRIDHVMGLFRLFWIPVGGRPADGTYVHYRWDELLAIVALESHRAEAHVVGEDLGTVEPYMRTELQARNVLSYRLLWFEDQPPTNFPRAAMAAVTTHDLPTIAGLFDGSDLEAQRDMGTQPNEGATEAMRSRVAGWLGLGERASIDEIIPAAHELLGKAPSVLVSATVDDALGVEERPNHPGTVEQWPNWSLALPLSVEEIVDDVGFQATARALATGRRAGK